MFSIGLLFYESGTDTNSTKCMRKRSSRAMTSTAILSGGDDPPQHSQKLATVVSCNKIGELMS